MNPNITSPREVIDKRSPLMKAQSRVGDGEKVNACPFGCEPESLDEMGYCKHLVGFTNDTEKEVRAGKARMEPMGVDHLGRRKVFGDKTEPVVKGDVLVQITCSSRVYRKET